MPACYARQYSDQMVCKECDLVWDMNDPDPPECTPAPDRKNDLTFIKPRPKRSGELWTEDEEHALKERFNNGHTAQYIADTHERSVSAVVTRLERMQLVYNIGGMVFRREHLWADIKEGV